MQRGVVQVALGRDGKAITTLADTDGWRRDGSTITTVHTFGPYGERVDATEVLLYVAGDGPDRIPLPDRLGLPGGVPFVYDLTLAFD
jgi:hypothetical protein